jgi:hypothetical protein
MFVFLSPEQFGSVLYMIVSFLVRKSVATFLLKDILSHKTLSYRKGQLWPLFDGKSQCNGATDWWKAPVVVSDWWKRPAALLADTEYWPLLYP